MSESRLLRFALTQSPWYRRNLVLSQAMIEDETPSIYESHSFFPESSSYTIISLKQGQGFVFNQDLFATPYQQLRALAMERKVRAYSMSQAKGSKCSSPSEKRGRSARRHTSYEVRPNFRARPSAKYDSAIEDDSMDVDSEKERDAVRKLPLEELEEEDDAESLDEEEDEDEDEDEDSAIEYEDEDDDDVAGGIAEGYMRNYGKVKVAEIVVDPNDKSYLPGEDDDDELASENEMS